MNFEKQPALDRGVFTLSLDFELIWGTLDLAGPERFRKACELEREVVIDRLLDLFTEFDVPATWCVVGHLFLDRCEAQNGIKHPDSVRPTHGWADGDWFKHDPGGSEQTAPLFFGRSLIEKIRACPTPQEIGSHSFSHVIFGDTGCSREAAESELEMCVNAAREMGIELRSFAFPRNRVGHLDLLQRYGITCYRGPEPNWYSHKGWPPSLKRLGHLWDVITAARPMAVMPEMTEQGLLNIPGSMIYFPAHGWRRAIPISLRVKRAIKGLESAAREKRVFHLWFHPVNMADRMDAMFAGLRRVLSRVTELRERGELVALPMCAFASQGAQQAGGPGMDRFVRSSNE
jgi:peptidoglycan/xylan/chitin deacetylase (PgdA/CDA1 family)